MIHRRYCGDMLSSILWPNNTSYQSSTHMAHPNPSTCSAVNTPRQASSRVQAHVPPQPPARLLLRTPPLRSEAARAWSARHRLVKCRSVMKHISHWEFASLGHRTLRSQLLLHWEGQGTLDDETRRVMLPIDSLAGYLLELLVCLFLAFSCWMVQTWRMWEEDEWKLVSIIRMVKFIEDLLMSLIFIYTFYIYGVSLFFALYLYCRTRISYRWYIDSNPSCYLQQLELVNGNPCN